MHPSHWTYVSCVQNMEVELLHRDPWLVKMEFYMHFIIRHMVIVLATFVSKLTHWAFPALCPGLGAAVASRGHTCNHQAVHSTPQGSSQRPLGLPLLVSKICQNSGGRKHCILKISMHYKCKILYIYLLLLYILSTITTLWNNLIHCDIKVFSHFEIEQATLGCLVKQVTLDIHYWFLSAEKCAFIWGSSTL